MFCLLLVLVKLLVVARKTPLRKSNCVEAKAQAKECLCFSWCGVLFHCFIVSCPQPYTIYLILLSLDISC